MYLDHFGIEKAPFNITPDTQLFFGGSNREAYLQMLMYAVEHGEGITKVIGEVGTGKTMLCRMLPNQASENIKWVYLAHPSLTPEQTLFAIANEMEIKTNSSDSKFQVMTKIQNKLLALFKEQKRVVLLVEEAQSMSLETLEEVRLLSNLETDEHKLIQIVLLGQPELDEKLNDHSIRQIRERIIHCIELKPLNLDDLHEYLNFRMKQVGFTGPEIFNKKISKHILKHSGGLIRRVNLIADKLLLIAFTNQKFEFTKQDVISAVNEHDFYKENKPKRKWWMAIVAFTAIFVTSSAFAHSWYQNNKAFEEQVNNIELFQQLEKESVE